MISYDTTIGNKGVVQVPLTVEGFGKRVDNPDSATLYEEGPWFYKRNNLYYMVCAASGIPENICYSTSTNATGPWTFRGVIMPTQGRSFTDHPGVLDYKGHSYFFYHNGALPGGSGFTRSVCIEEFKYNADGTFPTITMTGEGPAPLGQLNPYARTEAETMAWESGVKTEPCSQGGMDVCDIDNGDYIRIRNVDFGAVGAATFMASVASDAKPKASKGAAIELHLDSPDGLAIGKLPVSFTGGSTNWKTETTTVSGATGVHDLILVFKGESTGDLFKFDYWQFAMKSAAPKLVAINASVDRFKIDAAPGENKASMKVLAIYSDGTSKDVTAKAHVVFPKNGIATCKKGIVTGVKFGSIGLTVSYGGKTDTVQMIVTDFKTEFIARKITANVTDVKMLNGSQQSFSVTLEYCDGHTEDVTKTATYTVADPKIASVVNGTITSKVKGTTDIRVSFKSELGVPVTTQINLSVANRDPFTQNEAEDFNEQSSDVVVENSTEAGKNICNIENGKWVKFNALDFGSGARSFEVRVASATGGGNLDVVIDSMTGLVVGTCKVEGTGGWQNWVTKSCELKGAQGMHNIYLRFTGGPGFLFNVNWWQCLK